MSRLYTTRRSSIINSIVDLLKTINGSGSFVSNLSQNVFPQIKFIESLTDFPSVCVVASNESRIYQAGGYKDRFLNVKIILFANEENPLTKLDGILEDIETILEDNARLVYKDRQGNVQTTLDITINSISTDEGAFEPIAIGEMNITVRY
jgi:hypothetical protein